MKSFSQVLNAGPEATLERDDEWKRRCCPGTILLQDAALPEKHAFKVSAAAVQTYNEAFNFSFLLLLLQKLPLPLHLCILKRKIVYSSRHFPSDFLSVKGNIHLIASQTLVHERNKVKKDCNNL